jgi:hypothetical protein
MKTESQNKTTIKTIAAIVAVLAIAFISWQCSSSASFDKELIAASKELNKTCPTMIDEDSRLDSTSVLAGNIFQYNYTLVSASKDSVDVKAVTSTLEPTLINTVKTSPDLKEFRDHKVTMSYNYKDKDGAFLLNISVTPEKYAAE